MKPEILFITKSLPVMLLIGVNSYLSSCYTEIKKIGLTPGFTLYIWRRLLATPLVATPPDLELSIFHMCVSRFIHSNQEKGFWHGTCRLSRAGGREGGQGGLHRRLQAQERPHLWNLQRRWLSHPLREHWRYWKVEPAAFFYTVKLFSFLLWLKRHILAASNGFVGKRHLISETLIFHPQRPGSLWRTKSRRHVQTPNLRSCHLRVRKTFTTLCTVVTSLITM